MTKPLDSNNYNMLIQSEYPLELDWFQALAELLLNQTVFMINQQPHYLLEIEFYLHNTKHPDPFGIIIRGRLKWA